MNVPRTITLVAAATAIGVSFAPYLDAPMDARSLSQFSTDEPPAFWFGRAAVVLLVVTASAAFRSLRLAVGCALLAVGAAAAPVIVPSLRGIPDQGWTVYAGAPTPPDGPTIIAASMWGLGAVMAVATFTVAVLDPRVDPSESETRSQLRTIIVGVFTLVALGASIVVAVSYRSGSTGTPRRYVDYIPVPTGSNFSGSSAWYAAASVVLVLLAAACRSPPASGQVAAAESIHLMMSAVTSSRFVSFRISCRASG